MFTALQRFSALLVILISGVEPGWSLTPLAVANVGQSIRPDKPASDEAAVNAPEESNESRLKEAQAQLASALLAEANSTNQTSIVSRQEAIMRRAGLQRLVGIYEAQLGSKGELEAARKRRAEVARQAETWTGFAEPKPYSVLFVDALREEIQNERVSIRTAESALSLLEKLIEDNRKQLAMSGENLRRLNEELEGAKAPEVASRLTFEREMERTREMTAAATLGVLDTERQLREERLAGSRIKLDLLSRQRIVADASARFSPADLDKILQDIEADRHRLEREISRALELQASSKQALETAKESQRQLQTRAGSDPGERNRASELVELRQIQAENAASRVQVLRVQIEACNTERSMWEMRFAAHGTASAHELREAERRLESSSRRIRLWESFFRQGLDATASQIALQEGRVRASESDAELLPLARERLENFKAYDQALLRAHRQIERLSRLTERWNESLADSADHLPFAGRVSNLFSDTQSFLDKLWRFEIFAAEDTVIVDGQRFTGKRSVTIGKVIMALLILIVGYWIATLAARVVEKTIVKRFHIEPNQASLIRRWLRAVLIVCLVVFSLVSVKIPLTIFAFAGGALAIGLGFGTQTLLKNIVSGIIILFERPFRVGDVIEVDNQRGRVTGIGFRSSVVHRFDGRETLIPNSALLEGNLTNWTYTDPTARFSIAVGVAYGTDIRRVFQLLQEIVERHGQIAEEPKPQVLLADFGDDALKFELRFWVNVLQGDSARISSDLRQMISGAFNENGIVFAFPQRDVHLDTVKPLEVRLVPPTGAAAPQAPAVLPLTPGAQTPAPQP